MHRLPCQWWPCRKTFTVGICATIVLWIALQEWGNWKRGYLHARNAFNNGTFEIRSLSYGKATQLFDNELPIIYVITPTYTRHVQKAELTHMCSTLRHVRNLVWIVVEDSENKTDLVINFLSRCGVPAVHLNIKGYVKRKLTKAQRNGALQWLRENVDTTTRESVFCFADDDNTYDPEIFEQMRFTRKVSVWPVAFAGDAAVEGPVVEDGKVVDWVSNYLVKERKFPIDMAAFAVNVRLLHVYPEASFTPEGHFGQLETSFLESFNLTDYDLEPKANNCTQVLVWHTQRRAPELAFPRKTRKGNVVTYPWLEL